MLSGMGIGAQLILHATAAAAATACLQEFYNYAAGSDLLPGAKATRRDLREICTERSS